MRQFVEETPSGTPVFISGRSHFFDNLRELRSTLGLQSNACILSLSEFSEVQIEQFLTAKGWNERIPDWLPSRPLLLGYLASRGFLQDITGGVADSSPSAAEGWDRLVDKICDREARIDSALDGATVRRLLERMATIARAKVSGTGPIQTSELVAVFRSVCGYDPPDTGVQLLQRLPGMGVARTTDNAREFLDEDLVDTLRAGDVAGFALNPFGHVDIFAQDWNCSCGSHGLDVLAIQTARLNLRGVELGLAARKATASCSTMAAEIVAVMARRGLRFSEDAEFVIRDAYLTELEFEENTEGLGSVVFQECIFGHVKIGTNVKSGDLPRFNNCEIGVLDAVPDIQSMGVFVGCEYELLLPATTNADVMNSQLPDGIKVLLTILRKLFIQPGRGRRESALLRGLDQHARILVPDVLAVLQKHDVCKPAKKGGNEGWMPVRTLLARVRRIMASPSTSVDAIVIECREIY